MPTLSFVKIIDGWPTLDIGKCRHKCSILAYGPTSPPTFNAAGEALVWSPFYSGLRLAIEPMSGKDIIRGGQQITQLPLTAALWFRPGILPNMRVLTEHGSQYVITAIENVLEMNRVLTLNLLGLQANE